MENNNIIKHIYHLKNCIDAYITRKIEEKGGKGLVVSHGNILVKLYENDKQPMTKIAKDIGKCKSTLTVLVNKLEKAGFIEKNSDSQDTRVKNLALTEKGKDFQESFWAISDRLNNALWDDFSEEEKKVFIQLMNKMSKNLDKMNA